MIRVTLMLTVVTNAALPALADSQSPQTQVIEIPAQKLVFKPTRDDITVGCVMFSLYHANLGKRINLEAIRVNGAQPKTARLYLKQVAKNQFKLPALKIEFSSKKLGGPLYLTLKARFNELTNQYDSSVYKNLPDRYALVSYCTKEDDDPSSVNGRLGANRAATLKEFKERLGKPFVIELNQRTLQEHWGRYPMLPPGNLLNAAEFKAVEKTVRDKGEKYIIGISVADADHATVSVGSGTFFRASRRYKVVRSDRAWHVESVESIKDSSWVICVLR